MSDFPEMFDRDFREGRESEVLTNKADQRYHAAFGLVKDFSVDKALDVGCATGLFTNYLRTIANAVWGIDVSESAIRMARLKFPYMFQVGNLTAIPFHDSTFDLVSCLDVIYYLDDAGRKKAVDEIARVLKPTGYLLISTSWPWRTKTRTGTSYLTSSQLLTLFELKNNWSWFIY